MKAKILLFSTIALIAIGGVIYGFTSKKADCPLAGTAECPEYQNCPKKGQADCPLIQNCPKKGTADCPLVKDNATASKELANCPLAGTPDCPLVKNCPKKGTADCPYTKTGDQMASNTAKDEDLPPCCRKK